MAGQGVEGRLQEGWMGERRDPGRGDTEWTGGTGQTSAVEQRGTEPATPLTGHGQVYSLQWLGDCPS